MLGGSDLSLSLGSLENEDDLDRKTESCVFMEVPDLYKSHERAYFPYSLYLFFC